MKQVKYKFTRVPCLLAVLCLVVGMLTLGTLTVFAGDDSDKDFSFYKISSAAASYYDDTHNGESSEDFIDANLDMARAGGLVGFIDEDYDDGFIGSTVSFLSSSSQSRGYESFTEKGIRAYVQYGHALKSIGLDSTASDAFDIMAIVRFIGGGLLLVGYTVALFSDIVFGIIIKSLQTFNPFAWFMAGASNVSSAFAQWFGSTPNDPGVDAFPMFDGISQFVSEWYTAFSDMGMFVVFFLFFVTLGIALLTFNSQRHKVKNVFRTFITRLIFLCVGVPLLGGLYTMALDLAAESTMGSQSAPAANQVIASTLVDFESWASRGNLALPSGTKITVKITDSSGGSVDMGKSTSARGLSRAINAKCGDILGSDISMNWNLDITNGDGHDADWGHRITRAYDLLFRYMSSSFYHASDYETAYKEDYTKNNMNAGSGLPSSEDFYSDIKNKTGVRKQYSKESLFSRDSGAGHPYMYDGKASVFGPTAYGPTIENSSIVYEGGGAGGKTGLSSLSMYNYLTTVFEDSSVVTYSAKKATSGFVTKSHHSVNLLGTGIVAFLYWGNAMSIFFAITIIGIVYSFGLIFGSMTRGIKMVSSIPFAMLGNMRSMAKVCAYVAMMIIEVLGTFFVYSLVVQILLSLSGIIETPLMEFMSDTITSTIMPGIPGAAVNGVASLPLVVVGLLFSTIMYIWFSIKAVRMRKSIIKAMDEAVGNFIDRIFTVDPNGGAMSNTGGAGAAVMQGSGLGSKVGNAARNAANGLATGMAMAKGQDIMNKVMGGKGATAGSAEDGSATNSGGTDDGPGDGGGGVEGAERQGLPNSDDALDGQKVHGVQSDEAAGRELLSSGSNNLLGLRTGDEAKVPVGGETDKKQLATDAEISRMSGDTTVSEDMADDEAKRQVRKDAVKDGAKGIGQVAKGVGEGVIAYTTGDVKAGKAAVKDISEGSRRTAKAGKNAKNANTNVAANRQAKVEQRQTKSAQGSAERPAPIKSGNTNIVTKGGTTNVSTKNVQATKMMTQEQKLHQLRSEEKALEAAKVQVKKVGSATLPNGKVVNNATQVNQLLRKNKASQNLLTSGYTKTSVKKKNIKTDSDSNAI